MVKRRVNYVNTWLFPLELEATKKAAEEVGITPSQLIRKAWLKHGKRVVGIIHGKRIAELQDTTAHDSDEQVHAAENGTTHRTKGNT